MMLTPIPGTKTTTTNQTDPAEAEQLNAETLLNLGFIDVASWEVAPAGLTYTLDGPHADANAVRIDQTNALYAFVTGEEVLYIGKTARTIRKRLAGYCRPARSQSTNVRCNAKIKDILGKAGEVRILVFTPISLLRYGTFGLNIAAGLEDALIGAFNPAWNGREGGQPISEEAERETAEVPLAPEPPSAEQVTESLRDTLLEVPGRFEIQLGQAYYEQGIVNPGVSASQLLGQHGEPIQILFEDGHEPIISNINRNANRNGSVRLVGANRQISAWFKSRFRRGDTVQALILGPHHILMLTKPIESIFRSQSH